MTTLAIPEQVGDVSPSAGLIYTLLYYGDEMTQQELVNRAGLSERTVRNKAAELDATAEHFSIRDHPRDGRKSLYAVSSDARRPSRRR